MSKSVHQKKQRIAFNKTLINEDKEIFPKGCDILSSIMEEVDNKSILLSSMLPNKFKTDILELSKIPSQKKAQTFKIKNHMNVLKSRQFGVSHKSPLMEKCQRDLKQIKHNRKMPKPRAHLATLSNSPVKKSSYLENDSASYVKSQKTKAVLNNAKNTDCFFKNITQKPKKDKISSKQKKPCTLRSTCVKSSSVKSTSKKQKYSSVKTNSENSCLGNNKNTDSSSDSDAYEKFIQKEKEDLTKNLKNKKYSKKKLHSSTGRVAKKRNLKTILNPLSSESNEEFPLSKSYKKTKRRENKVVQNRLSDTMKETEYKVNNIKDKPHIDSFASDNIASLSQLANNFQSSSSTHRCPFVKEMSKGGNSEPYDLSSHGNLHAASTAIYDKLIFAQKTLDPVSSFASQPCVFPEKSINASSKGNSQSSIQKLSNVHSSLSVAVSNVDPLLSHKSPSIDSKMGTPPISCNTFGDSSMGACSTKIDLINVSIKPENSIESAIVDLAKYNNECDNTFVPKIVSVFNHSENKCLTDCNEAYGDDDSEIEMVDVIVYDLNKKRKNSDGNSQQNSLNNKGKLNAKSEFNIIPLSSSVKTQKQTDILQTPLTRIPVTYEAVFFTDICKRNDKNESKDKTLIQSNLKCDKFQKHPDAAEENPIALNKKMKTEPGNFCEIIFDSVSNSNTSQNFNTADDCSNKSLKTEKDFKLVKQTTTANNPIMSKVKDQRKEKDVDSSDLSNVIDACNRNPELLEVLKEVDLKYLKALYEEYNHEFDKYQGIVHTEQTVEATFKRLEMRQAEKVKFLKAQIDECLSQSLAKSEKRDSAKEMLLNNLQLNSLKALPPDNPGASVAISDRSNTDLKKSASINIDPFSSISKMDVKHNFSELQFCLKKEPDTSIEINSTSFSPKCIVCSKDAAAACQQCAKVFFCSNECGKKYWNDGHKDACAK